MAKKRTSMATKIKNPKPATSLSDLMAGANIKTTEDTKEDTEVKEETKVEETKETVSEETKTEAQIEHEKAKEDLEAKWAEEERIKEEIRQGHLNKIQRAEEAFEEGDVDVKKQVLDRFEQDVNDYIKENMHGDVKTNYEAALFRMQRVYEEALAKQQEEAKVKETKVEEVVKKEEAEETTQPFHLRRIMEEVERPKPVQPQNPNVWFCPSCGNGNTGASCVICGTPRPKAPKKKLKLDDKAEVFDPTILEGLEDYEDVVINGTARKNINIKNWLFRFLNSKKTRKMSVSDCIERAVIEYYKDEVKEINKAIRETLENDEDAVDQICYNSKKVEEVRAMIKAKKNKK